VSELFCLRNESLWTNTSIPGTDFESTINWALRCANELIQLLDKDKEIELKEAAGKSKLLSQLIEQQRQYYKAITLGMLSVYSLASREDFLPSFPRLFAGPEDGPIEPNLLDPMLLAGDAAAGRRFVDQLGRVINWEELLGDSDDDDEEEEHFSDEEEEFIERGIDRKFERNESNRLDLNLPLMQLFIASIFPWYQV
jgi:hypothetical protein